MDFFLRYKKLLILIGFIAAILFFGYLLYAIFFKPVPLAPPANESGVGVGVGISNGLPTAKEGSGQIAVPAEKNQFPATTGVPIKKASKTANGGLTEVNRLNNAASLGASPNPGGYGVRYYNKNDGKFYRVDGNGKITALTDKTFHSVKNIIWSPKKNKAILEYPDGANIIYDFANNKQITLPKHWKDFNFSPNGKQIVMKSMGMDPDNRWLAIVNDDGSKTRAIEPLGKKDATVYPSWSPNGQTIAMYTEGIDFDRQEVFFVGLNNENFKSTVVNGRGFQSKWQPSGNRLLYSVYSSDTDLKPNLWIVNARGESIGSGRQNLNVETWADKCAFSGDTDLYCAVPENLEEGAGLMPEIAKNTKDNLYKIDARTGMKKLIAVPDGSYNMSNIIISGNYLYFTDERTGKLYEIKLK